MVNKTKFYVCVDKQNISEKMIYYFFFTRNIWVNSIIKVGEYNYIVNVDYDKSEDIENLIGKFKVRAANFQINRIFKSMKIVKSHNENPTLSFLSSIICLASAKIKNTNIRIVTRTKEGEKWKDALIKIWQSEIENPDRFKRLGIKPQMDISPDGELFFHINKVGNYIVTYFDKNLNNYYS